VPYDGLGFVNLAITPSGGFNAPVVVTAVGAPGGFVVKPLTIPAGSTSGRLEVGAQTTLMLGAMFTLTLQAKSGSLSQMASVPALVTGAPATLDASFAAGGIFIGPSGGGGGGGAVFAYVQEIAQGKIVAAGETYNSLGGGAAFGLRLLSGGTEDTTFNTTGVVTHSFGGTRFGSAGALLREVDSSMVLAVSGWNGVSGGNDDVFLLRYQDNGTAAVITGDNGVNDIPIGGEVQVNAAAIQPNNTNVLYAGARASSLFVARVTETLAQGFPDSSFAAGKGWIAPLGATNSSASAFTFDASGNIVVTGVTSGTASDVALLRLTPDGALDTTFGTGGVVSVQRAGNQAGGAVAVQPDGKIVVAATSDENSLNQLLVQRFTSAGAPDTTFGTNGAVLVPIGGSPQTQALMVLMLDGRILVAGNGVQGATTGPVFVRLMPDGTLDPTLGSGGPVALYVGTSGAISAMSLTASGKVLIGGTINSGPGGTFIARLWN
jgi:uncharacterized delta-60 repeat protein